MAPPSKQKQKSAKRVPKQRQQAKRPKQRQHAKRPKPSSSRSRSRERKERAKKANALAKQHKEKLLDAKLARQRQRNRKMMLLRRKIEQQMQDRKRLQQTMEIGKTGEDNKGEKGGQARPGVKAPQAGQGVQESGESGTVEDDPALLEQLLKEDSFWRRFCLCVEDCMAALLYFLTVTLCSARTFDWLVFLANNLGLYQEYEINDYGQRLSPRTGRPVLLSLGPFRVVQVVESANQVRSHWDPYIREYLRNSKLTTDCWRANRMALQVALCMDESGNMFDMPISDAAIVQRQQEEHVK